MKTANRTTLPKKQNEKPKAPAAKAPNQQPKQAPIPAKKGS